MRRSAFVVAAIVTALVTIGGCAGQAVPPADASATALAASFGSCGSDSAGEGPGAQSFLASIADWQQVTEVADAVREGTGGQHTYPASVTTAGDGPIQVQVHDSFWPGVDWALAHDDQVWFGLGVDGFGPNMVGTVMVLTPDDVFFAGECGDDGFTKPVHAAYGEATRDVMTRLTGTTSKAEAQEVLGTTPKPTPTDLPTILAPGEGHDALLAKLTAIAIHATITKALGEGETSPALCTRIDAGWSDCINTDERAATTGFDFTGYVDVDGKLQFWLLGGDTDVTRPMVYLGTVQLPTKRSKAHPDKIKPSTLTVVIDTAGIRMPSEARSAAPDEVDPGYIHVESIAAWG